MKCIIAPKTTRYISMNADKYDWNTANQNCHSIFDTTLGTIVNEYEYNLANDACDAQNDGCWIGFYYNNTKWEWKSMLHENTNVIDWYSHQPNDINGLNNCGEIIEYINGSYGINNTNCNHLQSYLCEGRKYVSQYLKTYSDVFLNIQYIQQNIKICLEVIKVIFMHSLATKD